MSMINSRENVPMWSEIVEDVQVNGEHGLATITFSSGKTIVAHVERDEGVPMTGDADGN